MILGLHYYLDVSLLLLLQQGQNDGKMKTLAVDEYEGCHKDETLQCIVQWLMHLGNNTQFSIAAVISLHCDEEAVVVVVVVCPSTLLDRLT